MDRQCPDGKGSKNLYHPLGSESSKEAIRFSFWKSPYLEPPTVTANKIT